MKKYQETNGHHKISNIDICINKIQLIHQRNKLIIIITSKIIDIIKYIILKDNHDLFSHQ